MLDAELLTKMDVIGRAARNQHGVPFGGLQLIVTGDFYQLPPVSRGGYDARGVAPPFAFASDAWVGQIICRASSSCIGHHTDCRRLRCERTVLHPTFHTPTCNGHIVSSHQSVLAGIGLCTDCRRRVMVSATNLMRHARWMEHRPLCARPPPR